MYCEHTETRISPTSGTKSQILLLYIILHQLTGTQDDLQYPTNYHADSRAVPNPLF